jgi:DNA-directed RNA polymerase specialized sigma24 family protein
MSEAYFRGAYSGGDQKLDMAKDEPVNAYLSAAEVLAAIHALGPKDLSRLRSIARRMARFTPIEPDDLVQDALCRTMSGDRVCPTNVGIVHFLFGVMRSIVSDAAKAHDRHPEVQLEPLTAGGQDWPSDTVGTEDELIASEDKKTVTKRVTATREQVLGLFDDDPVAQVLAEGIMEGLEGEELRSLTELDKTAFASKRKLINRRLDKAFPERAKL